MYSALCVLQVNAAEAFAQKAEAELLLIASASAMAVETVRTLPCRYAHPPYAWRASQCTYTLN